MSIRLCNPAIDTTFISRLGSTAFAAYDDYGGLTCVRGIAGERALSVVYERDEDGQQLAFAIVTLFRGSPYLYAIAVLPEARRAGLANALLKDLYLRIPAQFGVALLELHVGSGNVAAMQLFSNQGFKELPEPPNGFRGWRKSNEKAIRMQKTWLEAQG